MKLSLNMKEFYIYCDNLFEFCQKNKNLFPFKQRVIANILNLYGMNCYSDKQYTLAKACFYYAHLLGNEHGFRNFLSVR